MKNRVIYRGIRWSRAPPSSARPRRCLIPRRGLPRSGSAIRRLINIAVAYDQGVRDVSCGDKSVHQRSLRKCYSERWSVDYRAGVQAEGSSGGQEEGGAEGPRGQELPLPSSSSSAAGCSQGLCSGPGVKVSLGPDTSPVRFRGLQPLGHLFPAEA